MKYDEEDLKYLTEQLRIDRDFLDEENICQPQNAFHAQEGHAVAINKRDHRKRLLELEIAKLDNDIRDSMITDGEKVTEDKVKAQLHREQDYQRQYKAYLDACLFADRWEALKNAYRQRLDALNNLVRMQLAGFFGEVTGAAERRGSRERFDSKR